MAEDLSNRERIDKATKDLVEEMYSNSPERNPLEAFYQLRQVLSLCGRADVMVATDYDFDLGLLVGIQLRYGLDPKDLNGQKGYDEIERLLPSWRLLQCANAVAWMRGSKVVHWWKLRWPENSMETERAKFELEYQGCP